MNAYPEVLKQCPLFSGITEDELNELLLCLDAKTVTASKDETVFIEGEPADRIGIVLSGSVHVIKEDYYGNRSLVGMAGPSEVFAEVFSCAEAKVFPVNVIAASDARLLLLDSRRILSVCGTACPFHNRLIANLLRIVATKSLMLRQKLEITSKRSTREKLLAFLLAEAKKQNSSEFTIPYDRQALADYLGVERSAMSAELSKLRREGVLECRKNHFLLLQ
ncbi:MAG: Crp/Fnr family transcriptional regulator [Lachnospiraceae bacterium]